MLFKFILLCILIFVLIDLRNVRSASLTTFGGNGNNFHNLVRNDLIKSIYLNKQNDTLGSRVHKQLKCLGDAILCRRYAPSNVKCNRVETVKTNLRWNCKAFEKSWHRDNINFKDSNVDCEKAPGYPGYVVKGSCRLRYSLKQEPIIIMESWWTWILATAFVILILAATIATVKKSKLTECLFVTSYTLNNIDRDTDGASESDIGSGTANT